MISPRDLVILFDLLLGVVAVILLGSVAESARFLPKLLNLIHQLEPRLRRQIDLFIQWCVVRVRLAQLILHFPGNMINGLAVAHGIAEQSCNYCQ